MLRFTCCCSSSSKLVSGALRAIASSTILSGPTANAFTASHHQLLTRNPPNFVSRHYLSTDAYNSIDRKLVKALKSEIKSHNHNLSLHAPQLPDDFPFTIHDDLGEEYDESDDSGLLTRELNGEEIEVSIAMPKKIQEELKIVAADEDGPDPGVCLPEPIRLDVRIRKENGKSVSFDVVICPRVLHVATMLLSVPDFDVCLRYYGEHDVEREGELQSALQEYLKMRGIKTCYAEYLKMRGIKTCYAEFMYRYMVWKSRHYMVWKSRNADLNMLHQEFKKFIKDS